VETWDTSEVMQRLGVHGLFRFYPYVVEEPF
jgi:hypothetical protein